MWIDQRLPEQSSCTEVHPCSSTEEEKQKEDEDADAAGARWCVRDLENLAISCRQELGEGSLENSQALFDGKHGCLVC